MRDQEVVDLYEAYSSIYTPQEETPNDFESWVYELVNEGYDLSEYTWDEMAEIYTEEVEQLDEKKGERPRGLPHGPVGKGFRTLTLSQRREMMKRAKQHTRAAMKSPHEYGPSHARSSAINSALENPRLRAEEYDAFDYILDHLISEGYADDVDAALVMMSNMSEDWRQSIVEGFPNVPVTNRPGDYGTGQLKLMTTPSGQSGYINPHSRGEFLPPDAVNKIMSGKLMVKRQQKSSTNNVA
jgi:hypothetical protein